MTNTIFFGLIENKKTFLLWEVHLPIKYSTMMGAFYHYNDLHCNVTGISTGLAVLKSSNARVVDRGSVKLMKLLSIKIRLGLRSELFKLPLP